MSFQLEIDDPEFLELVDGEEENEFIELLRQSSKFSRHSRRESGFVVLGDYDGSKMPYFSGLKIYDASNDEEVDADNMLYGLVEGNEELFSKSGKNVYPVISFHHHPSRSFEPSINDLKAFFSYYKKYSTKDVKYRPIFAIGARGDSDESTEVLYLQLKESVFLFDNDAEIIKSKSDYERLKNNNDVVRFYKNDNRFKIHSELYNLS